MTAEKFIMTSLNDFEQAIVKLVTSDEKKINQLQIKRCANTIRNHAEACGISPSHVTDVLKLATSGKFNSDISTILLHSLIPNESVPEEAVLCGISRMMASKCSLKIQEIFLDWVVFVYDLVNSKSALHALYGVLFNLLDYDILCPVLCHLLSLLTRPQDVTHFRIARILLLIKRVGSQPHINALMSAYRLHQPSLIAISHGQKAYFKTKNYNWTSNLLNISAPINGSTRLLRPSQKRRFTTDSILPAAQPQVLLNTDMLRTFEVSRLRQVSGVKSIEDTIAILGSLNLPRQAASLLSARHFQHILAIFPEPTSRIRLHFWLQEQLFSNFFEKDDNNVQQGELLKIVFTQRHLFKTDLNMQSFLYMYLGTWNGHSHTDIVLKLISSLSIQPFNVLQENVLSVLRKIFLLERNVKFRCQIINTLTNLCCNFIVQRQNDLSDENSLNWKEAIENVIRFTDNLLVIGISLHPNDFSLLHAALEFWISVVDMLYSVKSDILLLPHFLILYKGLFSCSSECVNGICSTILLLLKICTDMKQRKIHRKRNILETINSFIADVHDILWRHRAFHPFCSSDSIAFDQLDLEAVRKTCLMKDEIQVSSSFSVDKHPALITCTLLFCQAHQVPIEKTLTSELLFEPEYMKFLKNKGLSDILKLLQELTDL